MNHGMAVASHQSKKTTVEKGGQQPKQTFTDQFHRAEYDFAHYNLNL